MTFWFLYLCLLACLFHYCETNYIAGHFVNLLFISATGLISYLTGKLWSGFILSSRL